MTMTIVPMQEQHINGCAEIMATTSLWRDYYGVTYERSVQSFASGLADQRQIFLVALHGTQVVGFTDYIEYGAFFFGSYLRLLAVHEDYRGQGIGTQLITRVEANVREQTPNLFLIATQENTVAHHFYQKIGYKHVGMLPDFVVPGITEFIFWKRLIRI